MTKMADDTIANGTAVALAPATPNAADDLSQTADVKFDGIKDEPLSLATTAVEDGELSDDDIPLSQRRPMKPEPMKHEPTTPRLSNGHSVKTEPTTIKATPAADGEDSEDDVPLSVRKQKLKTETASTTSSSAKKKRQHSDDDEYTPESKKPKKPSSHRDSSSSNHQVKTEHDKKKSSAHKTVDSKKRDSHHGSSKEKHSKTKPSTSAVDDAKKTKKNVKKEDTVEVWKWWLEEKLPEGTKWKFLEHKGPMFAPPYEPLPSSVKFRYDGKEMKLSPAAEEVATFYGKMLDHDYTQKEIFNKNFFKDWRTCMTAEERSTIADLAKCDFRAIDLYFKEETEKRKNRTKEEKLALKEQREKEQKALGEATIDGHRQKVANFRIEPPGLFRGRGDHPKMGRLKRRINPSDVTINCSKDAKVPPPPDGHRWKSVQHDNSVSWLATWTENVLGQNKYIMLNPSSKIKGEKDHEKYEKARELKKRIGRIRQDYEVDFKSKEMRIRQRAVALYFIDKLALRAGNEKDDGETADTVGCCSLRYEHIKLYPELEGKEYVVEFDFLGKDSIRYFNQVSVPKRVYKNLELFKNNKHDGDDLFDRLNTSILNKHLQDQMDGLTAKVFRTYNASITLQEQLQKLTKASDTLPDKLLSYNRANRQVAILCNHQRAVPKTFAKSMENMQAKIKDKKNELSEAKEELKRARGAAAEEKAKKKVASKKEQLKKLKIQRTDKDENKDIALGTSKLNYLDPRISVAWAKKFDVPIERVYNKTQREKFQWAVEMVDETFVF